MPKDKKARIYVPRVVSTIFDGESKRGAQMMRMFRAHLSPCPNCSGARGHCLLQAPNPLPKVGTGPYGVTVDFGMESTVIGNVTSVREVEQLVRFLHDLPNTPPAAYDYLLDEAAELHRNGELRKRTHVLWHAKFAATAAINVVLMVTYPLWNVLRRLLQTIPIQWLKVILFIPIMAAFGIDWVIKTAYERLQYWRRVPSLWKLMWKVSHLDEGAVLRVTTSREEHKAIVHLFWDMASAVSVEVKDAMKRAAADGQQDITVDLVGTSSDKPTCREPGLSTEESVVRVRITDGFAQFE